MPASNIVIYEQYPSFLAGTRIASRAAVMDPAFPPGITAMIHENKDATMQEITVNGIGTKFVRPFTDATAVINVGLIKDHSICGYTGCLKNITHGATINPHAFHEHNASPQIAELYNHDAIKSRVRLHIMDGFKAVYHGGPRDSPEHRVALECVLASTDPVALDRVGSDIVDQLRVAHRMGTLEARGLPRSAWAMTLAHIGLGVLILGFNQVNPGVDLTFLGMPDCDLYATIDTQLPFPLAGPVTTLPVAIPATPSLAGFTFATQAATFTPAANSFGFLSSNGVALTVGL